MHTTLYREEVTGGRRVVIAEDEGGEWIFGRVESEDGKTWLGCIGCGQEITAVDAGMCALCRQDLVA